MFNVYALFSEIYLNFLYFVFSTRRRTILHFVICECLKNRDTLKVEVNLKYCVFLHVLTHPYYAISPRQLLQGFQGLLLSLLEIGGNYALFTSSARTWGFSKFFKIYLFTFFMLSFLYISIIRVYFLILNLYLFCIRSP